MKSVLDWGCFIVKKESIISISIFLALVFFSMPIYALAHPPSAMVGYYDYNAQELHVTVTHNVEDTSTHFIQEIEVLRNGIHATNRTYSNQATVSGLEVTFGISAEDGDIFEITATCNLGGEITLDVFAYESTTSTTEGFWTQFNIAWVVMLVVGTIIIGSIFVYCYVKYY
jgi:hypothetical protein